MEAWASLLHILCKIAPEMCLANLDMGCNTLLCFIICCHRQRLSDAIGCFDAFCHSRLLQCRQEVLCNHWARQNADGLAKAGLAVLRVTALS